MSIRILTGDCLEVLRTLPDASVNCVVTSPPYYGLRDYGVDGQIGLEETPEAYVSRLVEVFREVRRVLADDGTLWLNIGDSYASDTKGSGGTAKNLHSKRQTSYINTAQNNGVRRINHGVKPKDLIGIPWMLAFALRADGWYLRQDIIWSKPNPMPESVRDRCTKSHEYLFLLAKSSRYFYDADAVAEKSEGRELFGNSRSKGDCEQRQDNDRRDMTPTETRNKRSVWSISTLAFSEAHFATMAPELAETCIKAGTSEKGCCPHCGSQWARQVEKTVVWPEKRGGKAENADRNDGGIACNAERTSKTLGWAPSCSCPEHKPVPATVLDPFGGAGTTALCADRLGRNALLIELNPAYVEIARKRITQDAGMFAEVTATPHVPEFVGGGL